MTQKNISTIKCILFDMDGVLIDAKEWHYHALNSALRDFECPVITREQHLSVFDGLSTSKKLSILYDIHQKPSPEIHDQINYLKQYYTIEHAKSSCKPLDIHQHALRKLKREGYKMACCSNSIRRSVDLFLELAQLHQYLEFFLSNQDVSKSKPSPEIYLKAIERMGFIPQEVLVCEDNPRGLEAAYTSGAHVLEIETVFDLNYKNIKRKISSIEERGSLAIN